MTRTLQTVAAFTMIALISTACWKKPAQPGRGSNPAQTGSSGNKTVTTQDQAVKFAECVRKNGVSDFPDPNSSGEFVYGVSVSPAVFTKAVEACKSLQPPGTLSVKRGPEQQKAGLKFAQCMRDNGVKDFLDPVKGEPLVDTTRIPSSARNGGMTILNAAMETCRDLLAKAATGQ
jgi:hypothetical protein